jgi:hypothetical protein
MKSTPTRIGVAETQNTVEDGRNLEDRAILNARDAGAVLVEAQGDCRYAALDVLEGVEHDPGAVLLHPIRVVALLRHGPGVSHHDHGQALLDRFADAAGTRLADEKIAQLHEITDLRGKPDDGSGRARVHRTEFIGQRGIVAADQNELRIVEPLGDASHHLRAVTSEHDDARRSIRVELQLAPLGAPIDVQGPIEIRANDHSRSCMDARGAITGGSSLFDRLGGPANQVLRLMRLDPEMRR